MIDATYSPCSNKQKFNVFSNGMLIQHNTLLYTTLQRTTIQTTNKYFIPKKKVPNPPYPCQVGLYIGTLHLNLKGCGIYISVCICLTSRFLWYIHRTTHTHKQTHTHTHTNTDTNTLTRIGYIHGLYISYHSKNEMNGVLGHDSALVRLYWAGDNMG